jgi:glycosyltransferase involved in cell wall biosynthesis
MKIAYIVPGSGGTFYCQNCMRDNELIKSLKMYGHEIYMIPLYLPVSIDDKEKMNDTPVFYGAVNIYLKEKLSFYRHAPLWLEKLFDSQLVLRYAAKKSGSTRASGLEEMTLSMLHGENGRQASELDHLINFLSNQMKPDIVHLSNSLLLGLSHRLKTDLGCVVVCSLQDENEWIDPMSEAYQSKVWNLMAEKAIDVDVFITSSQYYAKKSQKQLRIPDEKVKIIAGGINLDGYEPSSLPFYPPVLGYMCRMAEYFGLGIVVDAFINIKKDGQLNDLKLHLTGGYTGDDKKFVKKMIKKIAALGFDRDVTIFEHFDKQNRIKFLKSLTLLSVPVPTGEAFGTYQVEALAAGVPIVQPNIGGYPEFIQATKGGILYEPNDPEHLAAAISSLLVDPERIKDLGKQGRLAVEQNYSMKTMAENMIQVYEDMVIMNGS